jgi:hypothetical protein
MQSNKEGVEAGCVDIAGESVGAGERYCHIS